MPSIWKCFGRIATWLLLLFTLINVIEAAPNPDQRGPSCYNLSSTSIQGKFEGIISPGDFGDYEGDDYSPKVSRRAAIEAFRMARYRNSIQAGRALWQQLLRTLESPPPTDPEYCDLSTRWDFYGSVAGSLSSQWEGLYPIEDIDDDAFYSSYVAAPKGKRPQYFYYNNQFSPKYGTVCAVQNNGRSLNGRNDAPDRCEYSCHRPSLHGLHLQKVRLLILHTGSDVTYAQWRSMCAEHRTDPSTLRFVLREFVLNGATKETVDVIFQQPEYQGPDGTPEVITLKPDDDGFMAMLRTPNVIGPLYMLLTYVNGLQRKTIKQITVRNRNALYIVIEFEKYVVGGMVET